MVRDAQINPLSRRLVHVDFLRVDLEEEVHVTVPLVLTGKAIGARTAATCTRACTRIPIAAKPAAIPTKLEVDVTRSGHRRRAPRQRPEAGRRRARAARPREAIASVVAPKAEKVEEAAAAPVEGAVPAEGAAAARRRQRRRGGARARLRRPPAARRRRRQGGEEGEVTAALAVHRHGYRRPRMHLVVGLGNPGREYQDNRHNLGFMVADVLGARARRSIAARQVRRRAVEVTLAGERLLLCKPMEFMNVSGQAVARVAGFWKIELDRHHRRARRARSAVRAAQAGRRRRPRRPQRRPVDDRRRSATRASRAFASASGGPPPGRGDPADYLLADFSRAEAEELPDIIGTRRRRGGGDRRRAASPPR